MAELVRSDAELRVQREIEARHLPEARAERLEAEQRFAASRPAPSRVGWSSRPTRKDLRRDERIAQEEAARARRLTPEDKELRRAQAQRELEWQRKRHATPATMEHATRKGSIASLYQTGTITAAQLAAAESISDVAERIGRDVGVRTASLETRVDGGRRGVDAVWEKLAPVRREAAYTAWRAALGTNAAVVLEMILGDGEGYSVVARRWRMHPRRGKRLLLAALDLWPTLMLDACRQIHQHDLDDAHTALGV